MGNQELQMSTGNLFEKILSLIEQYRQRVKTAVNTAMVYTYYHVGQYIVEEEQQGELRAAYGKYVLKDLSKRLTERLGEGWGYHSLRRFRQFYIVYSNLSNSVAQIEKRQLDTVGTIQNAKHCLSNSKKIHSVDQFQNYNHCLSDSVPTFTLSWSPILF